MCAARRGGDGVPRYNARSLNAEPMESGPQGFGAPTYQLYSAPAGPPPDGLPFSETER
jgi:hypothetical protein